MAGAYLLFISAVGYYVRFFGGDWGRALQLGLVVIALVVLRVLAVSGAVRARLRVFLGKHFFRYRYDYREEWLRFTQTLVGAELTPGDGAAGHPGAGRHAGESGRRPVAESAEESGFPAGGPLEHATQRRTRGREQPSVPFMQHKGWVINLEEYRSSHGATIICRCRRGC